MTLLIRFSLPVGLFLSRFSIDVMIGGTFDVSGLVYFCERCQSCSVELHSSVRGVSLAV